MSRWRRVLSPVAGLGLAAVVGLVVWLVATSDGERSPEATVRAFFEARREEDCGRLVDLTSASSWSAGDDDGDADRADAEDQCAAAVGDYQPELHRVEVVSEDEDQVTVQMAVRLDAPDPVTRPPTVGLDVSDGVDLSEGFVVTGRSRLGYETGRLVREGGQWEVEVDGAFLRLGPHATEQAAAVVTDYLAAYQDGDCEGMLALLAEEAWSAGGQLDRETFLERCDASVDARRDGIDLDDVTDPRQVHPVEEVVAVPTGEDQMSATVYRAVDGRLVPPAGAVPVVQEGNDWRLGEAPEALQVADLAHALLDEPVQDMQPGTVSSATITGTDVSRFEGEDAAEHRREAGFQRSVVRDFASPEGGGDGQLPERQLTMAIYEFEDADGALAYADHFGDRISQRASLDADGAEGVDALPIAEADGGRVIPLDSEPSGDGEPMITRVAALGARGRFLVIMEQRSLEEHQQPEDDVLADAAQVMIDQLDQL